MRFLKEALKGQLTSEEIKDLISSFDIIGDIVIVKIPDNLLEKKELIAKVILENFKNVKTVLRQVSPVSGDYRVRKLEYILGEEKFVTIYKEHGCKFKVDLLKVFFSPRLSYERLRIAKLVNDGEFILNMFGGIGTFSIIIAKFKPSCKVVNLDINPACYELAKKNIELNKVNGRVIPLLGDAKEVDKLGLKGKFDRVLMPYPSKAKEFLAEAVNALKNRKGFIHLYREVRAKTRKDAIITAYDKFVRSFNLRLNYSRVVQEIGPKVFEVVLDLES
jgi:tRNA (guanine37-N1)-methyltransferase